MKTSKDMSNSYGARMLRRPTAANYIGVSPTKFDELVKANKIPAPKKIDAIKLWDRMELDAWVDDLPREGSEEPNPWDA